jgi:hypothetical protein
MAQHDSNYHELIINSKDRSSGTSTNFTVAFNQGIIMSSFYIKSLTMPQSWYTFTTGSYFYITVNGGARQTVTLPVGSYFEENIINTLNSVLPSGIAATMTYTNWITLTASGATSISVSSDSPLSVRTLITLGFAPGYLNTQVSSGYMYSYGTTGASLNGVSRFNQYKYNSVYISLPSLVGFVPPSIIFSSRPGLNNKIIATRVSAGYGYNINQPITLYPVSIPANGGQVIFTLTVQVIDDEGQVIDNNDVDWTMVIAYYV